MTGHYHKVLLPYVQELDLPVDVMHVQKRQSGLLKTDKRDARAWRATGTTSLTEGFT